MNKKFFEALEHWYKSESNLKAVALAGSHAHGTARPDSDIDLIIVCANPDLYLRDNGWIKQFGETKNIQREDWGLVQTWRTFFDDGLEIEFNIASEDWCADTGPASGTARVVRDGIKILFDPESLLANLIEVVHSHKE